MRPLLIIAGLLLLGLGISIAAVRDSEPTDVVIAAPTVQRGDVQPIEAEQGLVSPVSPPEGPSRSSLESVATNGPVPGAKSDEPAAEEFMSAHPVNYEPNAEKAAGRDGDASTDWVREGSGAAREGEAEQRHRVTP